MIALFIVYRFFSQIMFTTLRLGIYRMLKVTMVYMIFKALFEAINNYFRCFLYVEVYITLKSSLNSYKAYMVFSLFMKALSFRNTTFLKSKVRRT